MTTLYNQHTYSSVFVGQTGHTHTRAADADTDLPFAVDCGVCEPYLVREGWVYNTELVPPTDVQLREQERLEREGNIAVKQAAEAMATVIAKEAVKSTSKAARRKATTA